MNQTTKFIIGAIIAIVIVWGVSALFRGNTGQIPPEEEVRKNGEVVDGGAEPVDEVIKLGFIGPLTGDAASYGESIKRGVDLALKDLDIENIEIIYEDSQCDAKEAVNAINKLISIDKVVAVIGEACSPATLAAVPVAEENEVVLISAASTAPDLTEAGEYFYRTVPSDALQGSFAAQLVYDRGYRKLAVLFINDDYGIGFQEVLKSEFEELGGAVVGSETFERNVSDVRTQITKVKAENPDAIYIISNSPGSAVAALKQIKELNVDAAIFGAEGLKGPDILEGAKEAAEGLVVSSVSSGTSEFAVRYNEEYKSDPGPFAAQSYDATMALVKAIETGARTGEEIKEALKTVQFEGASGTIVFDENGDIFGNYDVYVVQDGEFVLESDAVTKEDAVVDEEADVDTDDEGDSEDTLDDVSGDE